MKITIKIFKDKLTLKNYLYYDNKQSKLFRSCGSWF